MAIILISDNHNITPLRRGRGHDVGGGRCLGPNIGGRRERWDNCHTPLIKHVGTKCVILSLYIIT